MKMNSDLLSFSLKRTIIVFISCLAECVLAEGFINSSEAELLQLVPGLKCQKNTTPFFGDRICKITEHNFMSQDNNLVVLLKDGLSHSMMFDGGGEFIENGWRFMTGNVKESAAQLVIDQPNAVKYSSQNGSLYRIKKKDGSALIVLTESIEITKSIEDEYGLHQKKNKDGVEILSSRDSGLQNSSASHETGAPVVSGTENEKLNNQKNITATQGGEIFKEKKIEDKIELEPLEYKNSKIKGLGGINIGITIESFKSHPILAAKKIVDIKDNSYFSSYSNVLVHTGKFELNEHSSVSTISLYDKLFSEGADVFETVLDIGDLKSARVKFYFHKEKLVEIVIDNPIVNDDTLIAKYGKPYVIDRLKAITCQNGYGVKSQELDGYREEIWGREGKVQIVKSFSKYSCKKSWSYLSIHDKQKKQIRDNDQEKGKKLIEEKIKKIKIDKSVF